jgi:hypothetical protein
MFIPHPDFDFLPIPDPSIKKAPDPDPQYWVKYCCEVVSATV